MSANVYNYVSGWVCWPLKIRVKTSSKSGNKKRKINKINEKKNELTLKRSLNLTLNLYECILLYVLYLLLKLIQQQQEEELLLWLQLQLPTTITITIKNKTKQPQGPPWSLSRDFLIQSLIFPLFPRILIQYIPIFVHANKCNQKQKRKDK